MLVGNFGSKRRISMKKKILALTIALTMCLGSTMTVNAAIPMLPGSGSGSGALSSLNNDKLTIKDIAQTNSSESKSYKSNYTKLEVNVIKSLFDPEYYAKQYPDVVSALGNSKEALWNHYVSHGLAEGRQINKYFNVLAYSAAYPDLQKAFGDDILAYYVHYMNYGKNENRQFTSLEKVARAGITITGMNGQVIASPGPVVPKINLVGNNSNNNSDEADLASAVMDTMNNGSDNGRDNTDSSGSEGQKPEEAGCQHKYVNSYDWDTEKHYVTKKCSKCGDIIDGGAEPHNKKWEQDCHDDSFWHRQVCDTCGWAEDYTACEGVSYDFSSGQHWMICNDCKRDISAPEEHSWNGGRCTTCGYDCQHQWNSENGGHSECILCGYVCINHNWITKEARPSGDGWHTIIKICSICGKKLEEGEQCGNNNYYINDGNDGHHAKCSECGYDGHTEHDWDGKTGRCIVCDKKCNHENKSVFLYTPDGTEFTCNTCGYRGIDKTA